MSPKTTLIGLTTILALAMGVLFAQVPAPQGQPAGFGGMPGFGQPGKSDAQIISRDSVVVLPVMAAGICRSLLGTLQDDSWRNEICENTADSCLLHDRAKVHDSLKVNPDGSIEVQKVLDIQPEIIEGF